MAKLLLTPSRASYSVEDGLDFIEVELEGGAPRFRRDKIGSAKRVSCQWELNESEKRYWDAFYETGLNAGADWFTIDLIIDDYDLEEFEAHFASDSRVFDGQEGKMYTVQADLFVIPNERNTTFDALIINTFEADQDTDLTALTEPSVVAAPEKNGSIPSQVNDNGDDIGILVTSTYFTDVSGTGLTYTASNLPGGLGIGSGGNIFGTIEQTPTTLLVTVVATGLGGSVSQQFSWTINVS